jgi:hypothetical protein
LLNNGLNKGGLAVEVDPMLLLKIVDVVCQEGLVIA